MDKELELPLRIVMEDPVPGVTIALQRGLSGKAELIGPVSSSPEALVFEFDINLRGATADGTPRLLGPFVQGPPTARFVYLNSGAAAGQAGTTWQRRAKVPLSGLSWALIDALPPGVRLEARIAGKSRDGGPACASVPLLAPGWRMASTFRE